MSERNSQIVWNCANHVFDLADRTLIMGVLNVTPDSFSDGGQFVSVDRAVDHALQMGEEGADIIDIGGESTKPGAEPVPEQLEMDRTLAVIEALHSQSEIPISVDTYKSAVAKRALASGAVIVNDISACRFDINMPSVVAAYNAGLVLMHMKGEPRSMQIDPSYQDVLQEISDFLSDAINRALKAGVQLNQMVIDPGIGFGKRLKDNFQILRELRIFERIGRPILVGPSRKSFIGRLLDLPTEERLEGTIAAVTASILNGVHIVRVHDVKAIKRAATIADAIAGKINVGE